MRTPQHLIDPAGQGNHMLNYPLPRLHDPETCEHIWCEICFPDEIQVKIPPKSKYSYLSDNELTDSEKQISPGFNGQKFAAVMEEPNEEYRIETTFYVEPMLSQIELDTMFARVTPQDIAREALAVMDEDEGRKRMDALDQRAEQKFD